MTGTPRKTNKSTGDVKAKKTPSPKKLKLNAKPHQISHPWTEVIQNLPAKEDYRVEYFFTNEPNQGQRDFIAQAMAYFNPRTKRQTCPNAAEVDASLTQDVQGLTTNRTAATALAVTFKTAKHMVAMFEYIATVRNQRGDVTVNISVDKSPFFTVL